MYIHPEIARSIITQRIDEWIAQADASRRALHARQGRERVRRIVARKIWPFRDRKSTIARPGPAH